MTGLLTLSRAILLSFRRDKSALFFTILFPLVFLVIIGGLFGNGGTPHSKVIEVGSVPLFDSLGPAARTQVAKVLTITRSSDLDSALASVRNGDDAAAIEQRGNQVIMHYSAADPTSAGIVQSVMESLVQSANLAGDRSSAQYTFASATVEDKSLKEIQYLTPGILGWAIAAGATFGAASTLVLWRRSGILRQLMLCPVDASTVVCARILVSLGIALVQAAIFIVVAALIFGLRLTNYWWTSIPLIVVGTLAFLSIGLLIGAKAQSIEAASALSNIIVIPMAFLSGSFFQISLAPSWVQKLSEFLPLRHLNDGMLNVMARGDGPGSLLPELGALAAFGLVFTVIAVRVFRWSTA